MGWSVCSGRTAHFETVSGGQFTPGLGGTCVRFFQSTNILYLYSDIQTGHASFHFFYMHRLFICFCLIFWSHIVLAQDQNEENEVLDLIWAIPEVVQRNEHLKSTNDTLHLEAFVNYTSENLDSNYYWVKVGVFDSVHFATHFNFYVYFNSFDIKYFDTLNDQILSLEQWRINNKQ